MCECEKTCEKECVNGDTNKIEHLKFIYGYVERMALCSIVLKVVASSVTALLAACFGPLAIWVPLLAFWPLDSYYQLQEERYQVTYSLISLGAKTPHDFAMNLLQPSNGWPKGCNFFGCLLSRTEAGFYILLAVALYVVTCAGTI